VKYKAPVRVSALVRRVRRLAQRDRHDVLVSAYPFWALVIIAVGIVAIYGLCAYGSRANFTAA
jgi:hypothetical protein